MPFESTESPVPPSGLHSLYAVRILHVMSIERELSRIGERLNAARDQLRISLERLSYLSEVADEAKTTKLVSESPLAAREYKEAVKDLEIHRRSHQALQAEIASLEQERNRLLDRIAENG